MYVSNLKKFLSTHRALQCTCCKIATICLSWISDSKSPEILKHTYLFIYWELLLHYRRCWPQVIVRAGLVKLEFVFSYSTICRKLSNLTFDKTSIIWSCATHIHKGLFQSWYFKKSVFFHNVFECSLWCNPEYGQVWAVPKPSLPQQILLWLYQRLALHCSICILQLSLWVICKISACLSTPLKATRK